MQQIKVCEPAHLEGFDCTSDSYSSSFEYCSDLATLYSTL